MVMMLKQAFKFVYISLWRQKTLHSSMACYVQVLLHKAAKQIIYYIILCTLILTAIRYNC
jgi:hypothetical protein